MAYHGNWLINWALILGIAWFSKIAALTYICLISVLMTYRRIGYFFWGIVYQIIFPIFHIVWIYNLIIGEKNNGNE